MDASRIFNTLFWTALLSSVSFKTKRSNNPAGLDDTDECETGQKELSAEDRKRRVDIQPQRKNNWWQSNIYFF